MKKQGTKQAVNHHGVSFRGSPGTDKPPTGQLGFAGRGVGWDGLPFGHRTTLYGGQCRMPNPPAVLSPGDTFLPDPFLGSVYGLEQEINSSWLLCPCWHHCRCCSHSCSIQSNVQGALSLPSKALLDQKGQ
ncbi:hypothetical protein KIL84_000374 [Mauremys mutica]|uniref:Uncharacterized protein n=1 Tax=Mauremys mutica TaxID=74926 RepID=A0A9D3XFQ3_9SAUR|nr:hypothetical protein KIL84_000374 [Mauremys mutica]